MRNLYLPAILTILLLSASTVKETVRWDSMIRDFGELPEDTTVTAVFTCYNMSDSDLHIENISLPCHCTTAEPYERKVAPHDSAKFRIKYSSAGRKGTDEKYIGVYTGRGMYELVIRARIRS